MWNKLKKLLEFSSKNGLYLPSAYDNRTGIGSVSLLFAHSANIVALAGIITLLYKDLEKGVISAIIYAILMLVFYLIRSISKFKVDVGDGEIEVDSGEKNEN